MTLEIGKVYKVDHQRKGKFTLKMLKVDDVWCTGEIVEGYASALLPYNEREKGEEVTLRISFGTFEEVTA